MAAETYSGLKAVWGAMKPDLVTTRLFFDPLAVPLTLLLARLKVPADAVTLAALLPGLAAAAYFARGAFAAGAAAYYLFFLLDTVDGKLARLTGSSGPLGAFHDFVADRVVIGAMLLGMGWALARDARWPAFLLIQGCFLLFFLKDVLDLKWKETGIQALESSGPSRSGGWTQRWKIHFRPGQLLAGFVLFLVAPLSGALVPCAVFAIGCLLVSLAHNALIPWLRHLRAGGAAGAGSRPPVTVEKRDPP